MPMQNTPQGARERGAQGQFFPVLIAHGQAEHPLARRRAPEMQQKRLQCKSQCPCHIAAQHRPHPADLRIRVEPEPPQREHQPNQTVQRQVDPPREKPPPRAARGRDAVLLAGRRHGIGRQHGDGQGICPRPARPTRRDRRRARGRPHTPAVPRGCPARARRAAGPPSRAASAPPPAPRGCPPRIPAAAAAGAPCAGSPHPLPYSRGSRSRRAPARSALPFHKTGCSRASCLSGVPLPLCSSVPPCLSLPPL